MAETPAITIGEPFVTYYRILTGGSAAYDRDALCALLDPNLAFDGPIAGHVVGAQRFAHGVAGFIDTVHSISFRHQVRDGNIAATCYDSEMPGGTVRFAEFFEIADGKILALTLLYDAAEYRARGGR